MKTIRIIKTTAVAVSCMALCSVAVAQTGQTNSGQNSQNNRGSANNSWNYNMAGSDTMFIGKNIRDNMMEIQMSQLARDKATSKEVKDLAKQMVKNHGDMLKDLRKAGRKKGMSGMNDMTDANGMSGDNTTSGSTASGNNSSGSGTTGSGSTGSGSGSTGSGSTGSGTTGSGSTGSGSTGSGNTGSGTTGSGTTGSGSNSSRSGSDTMGMRGDMNHDMNGMSGMNGMNGMNGMDALNNATGAAFETAWVSQMLTMHEAKLAELQAASTQLTDADLKAIATKAIPKIRMHRDTLLRLNKGTNSTNSNSNNSSNNRNQ